MSSEVKLNQSVCCVCSGLTWSAWMFQSALITAMSFASHTVVLQLHPDTAPLTLCLRSSSLPPSLTNLWHRIIVHSDASVPSSCFRSLSCSTSRWAAPGSSSEQTRLRLKRLRRRKIKVRRCCDDWWSLLIMHNQWHSCSIIQASCRWFFVAGWYPD